MTHLLSVAIVDTSTARSKPSTGIKGRHLHQSVGRVHVAAGPSDGGKSTLLLTPILVALGLAETSADPLRPYLGPVPERTDAVCVFVRDGERVEVRRDLSSTRGRSAAAADLAASEVMGRPPVRWDLRDYGSMTDGQRAAVLDAILRAGGDLSDWTTARAVEALPAGEWRDKLAATIDQGLPAAEWVARAITYAGPGDGYLYTPVNTRHRELRAHAEELGAALPPLPEGDAAADATEAERLRAAIAAEQSVLADIERAATVYDAWAADGARLRDAHDAAREALAAAQAVEVPDAPDLAPLRLAVEAATARHAEARRRLDEAKAIPDAQEPVDLSAEDAAVATAREALEAARQAVGLATQTQAQANAAYRQAEAVAIDTSALAAANEALTAAEGRVSRAREAHAGAVATLAAIEGSDTDTCVHCGAADPLGRGGHIETARRSVADSAEAVEDAEAMVRIRQSAVDRARAAVDEAEQTRRAAIEAAAAEVERAYTAHRQAEAQVTRCERALSAADAALERARSAAAARRSEARAARLEPFFDAAGAAADAQRTAAAALADAEQAVRLAARKAEDKAAAVDAAGRALDAAAAAWERWQATEAPPAPGDATEVQARIEAHRADLAPLTARQKERDAHAQALEQYEQAVSAADAAQARLDALEATRRALVEVRDAIQAAAYGPLQAAANRLLVRCGDAIPWRIYVDGPSEMGTVDPDGTRASMWELGGGRGRIFAAAMAVAFAAVSKAPWRPVYLDELETILLEWRAALLSALVASVEAGEIDNAICTWQCSTPPEVPEGVTLSWHEETTP